MISKKENELFGLDFLRGITAIYVVIGHSRWLLWEGFTYGFKNHPEKYTFFSKSLVYFFSIFSFGHGAVMLFFVLSGFVIHLNYNSKFGSFKLIKTNFFEYFIKRFARIYPPLLLAILVTFVLDKIGILIFPKLYLSQTVYPNINQNLHYNQTFLSLFGSLFNISNLITPTFGSNGALWSLAYEWWFYMIYPFVLIKFNNKNWFFYLLLFSLMLLGSNKLLPFDSLNLFFVNMFCWLFGCFLADLYRKDLLNKINFLYILAIFIGLIYSFNLNDQLCFTMGAFLIIFLIILFNKKIVFLKKIKRIADFSYSLYLLHLPILVLFSSMILRHHKGYLPMHFNFVVAGVLLSIIVSYFVYDLVEFKIPRFLTNKFLNKKTQ